MPRFYREEVGEDVLRRIIGAAFKTPTNDHLRQLEFVVVRGRENIARFAEPLAKNMASFRGLVFEVDESGEADKMEMFRDALPKQQRMLMESGVLILPFYRQLQYPLTAPAEQSSLNYFASAWAALENMLLAAANEGLGAAFHVPVAGEAEEIKRIAGSPDGYEFLCLLALGRPAPDAFMPRQKEIDIPERIHYGRG